MDKTTKTKEQLYFNCLMIEGLVKSMVVNGTTNDKELIKAVENMLYPQTEEEMELYSEAIIYAKYSVLN